MGPFHVAATDRGVVAVEWLTTDEPFEAGLWRGAGSASIDDAASSRPTTRGGRTSTRRSQALEGTPRGRPAARSGLRFDLADRPAWDRRVLGAVAAIPWGTTASYGEIARRRRRAAARRGRSVARVGRNPISLLIPCHRVIAADGTIGGYGGDGWGSCERSASQMKRELLRREGVTVAASDR